MITAGVSLDLMELDGKATPSAIVGEIMRQNPDMPMPVPLEAIAALGGIKDIKELTTDGFEGMLLTNPEKSEGVIAVKANGNPQRRRFTLGHELGHYFLPWHRQTSFSCTAANIKEMAPDSKAARGVEMEAEANAFASEILMPSSVFKKKLRAFGDPDIEQVVRLSEAFDASICRLAGTVSPEFATSGTCSGQLSPTSSPINELPTVWRSNHLPFQGHRLSLSPHRP